jgi:hypothetical protein
VIENRLYFVFYSPKICPHLPPNRLVTRVQFPNVAQSLTQSRLGTMGRRIFCAPAISDPGGFNSIILDGAVNPSKRRFSRSSRDADLWGLIGH